MSPKRHHNRPAGTASPWDFSGLLWFRLNHLLLTRNKRVCLNSSKWTNNNPQLQIKDSYSQEKELFIHTQATESSKLIHWARLLIYCEAPFTPEVWWKTKTRKDSCLLSQEYSFCTLAEEKNESGQVVRMLRGRSSVRIVAVMSTFAMRVWSREGG